MRNNRSTFKIIVTLTILLVVACRSRTASAFAAASPGVTGGQDDLLFEDRIECVVSGMVQGKEFKSKPLTFTQQNYTQSQGEDLYQLLVSPVGNSYRLQIGINYVDTDWVLTTRASALTFGPTHSGTVTAEVRLRERENSNRNLVLASVTATCHAIQK